MAGRPRVLWVGQTPEVPENVRRACEGWELARRRGDRPLGEQLGEASVAVIGVEGATGRLAQVLSAVQRGPVLGLVLLPPGADGAWEQLARRNGRFLCVREDASVEELSAKIEAAATLRPLLRERRGAETAGGRVGQLPVEDGHGLTETDEEMRLAARLQRDFLPRGAPEVEPLRFTTLYRPAGWLSGDIYDIARLDETHVGFYVADAVGHGLPAALLTMFIKRALEMKRIYNHSYQIVSPEVSLAELNRSLCEQGLSSCEFCTAVYCVVDIGTLTMSYARAGHPEPLLVRADGTAETLDAPGPILGVFPEAKYELRTVQLARGDRLLAFSDGVEGWPDPQKPQQDFRRAAPKWSGLFGDEMISAVCRWIESDRAAPMEEDDITVVGVDVLDDREGA